MHPGTELNFRTYMLPSENADVTNFTPVLFIHMLNLKIVLVHYTKLNYFSKLNLILNNLQEC
jgi:hypothetical protein